MLLGGVASLADAQRGLLRQAAGDGFVGIEALLSRFNRRRPVRRWRRHDFKVLLINFPQPRLADKPGTRRELMSLAMLAGVCRQYGFSYEVLDAVIDPSLRDLEALAARIARHQRVVLCFHLMAPQWVTGAQAVIDAVDQRGVEVLYTMAGGNYATIYREEVLASLAGLDRLILGEGEYEMLRALYQVMYGRQRNGRAEMSSFTTVDPTSTPSPVHYAIGMPDVEPIEVLTSRGCPGRCTFCEIACFYGKTRKAWRRRSVAAVRREILDIHRRTGQTFFHFIDDAFLYAGESSVERQHLVRSLEFLQRRIPGFAFSIYAKPETVERRFFQRLHEVGLRKVFYGIESFNAAWLRLLKKAHTPEQGIRALQIAQELGLVTEFGFIIISPLFTIDDIARELRMLRAHATFATIAPSKLANAATNAVLVYRHTKMYEIFKHRGWLREQVYDGEFDIYAYQVDPRVGAYRTAMETIRRELPEPQDRADALHVLSIAEEVCSQLRTEVTA